MSGPGTSGGAGWSGAGEAADDGARGVLAQQVAARILPALESAAPVVRVLSVVVRVVAGWTLFALVMIVAVCLHRGLPEQWAWWVPVGLLVVVGVLPPVVLWLFGRALSELAELPAAIRRTPGLLLDHRGELSDLVTDTRTNLGERGRGVGKLPGNLWRAGKLAWKAHKDLPEYGEAIRLVSPPFLIVVGWSLAAALFEAFLVPVLLLAALILA